jgi:hypothetical protein
VGQVARVARQHVAPVVRDPVQLGARLHGFGQDCREPGGKHRAVAAQGGRENGVQRGKLPASRWLLGANHQPSSGYNAHRDEQASNGIAANHPRRTQFSGERTSSAVPSRPNRTGLATALPAN